MAKKLSEDTEVSAPVTQSVTIPVDALAAALAAATTAAIEEARPRQKTVANRKKNTPWTPKDGSLKPKFKRKFYQHALPVKEKMSSSEEIHLWNKLRPGTYMNGLVVVTKRSDKGLDLDYKIKNSSDRLKIANFVGASGLTPILKRCVEEAATPKPSNAPDPDFD